MGILVKIRLRVDALCVLASLLFAAQAHAAPPVISGNPTTTIGLNAHYNFQPTAYDPDGTAVTFQIANKPAWATFEQKTGRLYGAATPSRTYSNIRISVVSGGETRTLPAFSINVAKSGWYNSPPVITGTPSTSVSVGGSYRFAPTAWDRNGHKLTYSVTNRPAWASFDNTTGVLSGIPTSAHVRTYSNVLIHVTDGYVSVSLPPFNIVVRGSSGGGSNAPPSISGSPPSTVTAGGAYRFQPSASDANGDALTFSIQNRPSWSTFDTRTGVLSGTPSASHVGTYNNIVLRVTDGRATTSMPAFSITVRTSGSSGGSNAPPVLSGTPATSAVVGSTYRFQPSASDPNGDTLGFSIQNRPSWATFNTTTGVLSGQPTLAHVGTFSNIVIRVSDGRSTVSLPAFSIAVSQASSGTASLSWTPPTRNTNGSALTNLAGYRIYYGTSSNALTQQIQISNPGVASYVVQGLRSGTYYFAVRAYNSAGAESALSNVASKTVR